MPRAERVSNIQALAWLNAIAENDSGDESEGENVCKGLEHACEGLGRQIQTKFDLQGK